MGLAGLGAAVTLLSERPVKADASLLEKLQASEAITQRSGVKVLAIEGTERVTGVKISETSTKVEDVLPVDGIFIETGSIPVSEFTGGSVETNERGEIVIDGRCATSVSGIYAAGDVSSGLGKQIIIAAGEGARAAMAAAQDLKRGSAPTAGVCGTGRAGTLPGDRP